MYKKGQLTLWVLIAILDGKKYAQEIAVFMADVTNGVFSVTDQSLYRALRRFKNAGLVTVSREPSPDGGPDRKYYQLTADGKKVLSGFVALHIKPLQSSSIKTLLNQL